MYSFNALCEHVCHWNVAQASFYILTCTLYYLKENILFAEEKKSLAGFHWIMACCHVLLCCIINEWIWSQVNCADYYGLYTYQTTPSETYIWNLWRPAFWQQFLHNREDSYIAFIPHSSPHLWKQNMKVGSVLDFIR